MYCLVKQGRVHEGTSILAIVSRACKLEIDYSQGIMYIDGVADTITYSREYTNVEMEREMVKRALTLLQRAGWTYYESKGY